MPRFLQNKFFILVTTICFICLKSLSQTDTISIETDLLKKEGKLTPVWAYFGYDEPNYTYMKDGKKLLNEIARFNQVPVYVRIHNLLTSGDGSAALKWGSTNAYIEDKNGNPVYNWAIVDSIFDTYIHNGMKPIAEIGFMPEALSTKPTPYRHYWKPGDRYDDIYTGWAYPPKDYKKWGALVYEWVKHSIQRYGANEVATWWWEVWNEPNISYWKGTEEEYFMLYDYAADAVKRALPAARIGGPTSTGPGWDKANLFLKHFLEHCANGKNYATGQKGASLDYISFHAKGSPKVVDGHVRMNMTTQLKDITNGFETIAASAFKNLPVIIGECDPEGCAACGMATNPENAYRNGTMYSSYTASSFVRIMDIAKRYNIQLEGAVSWSFEFENQRWFYGFRDLATNGIDKPVLNIFRMFSLLHEDRIHVHNNTSILLDTMITKGVRGTKADIDALASAGTNGVAVMIWNYHDDDLPAADAIIKLNVQHLKQKKVLIQHYRVDKDNSNSYEAWKKMGSPQDVNAEQYAALEKISQLSLLSSPEWKTVENGTLQLSFSLPRQAVSLVKITY
ncbi:MAG: beta-xylosidase [Agriterribacter sp.]